MESQVMDVTTIGSLDLETELRGRVELVWQEDLHSVERQLGKYGFEEQLSREIVIEYKKFLTLLCITGERFGMYSPLIDAAWHGHIIHTREYERFSAKVFGTFLHHEPVELQVGSKATSSDGFSEFRKSYESCFGGLPQLWKLDCQHTCRIVDASDSSELCIPT